MPAIPPYDTDSSTAEWDGQAAEAQLSDDAGQDTLRKAYAWVDPDGDAGTKDAYRFLCHDVTDDGAPGPVNLNACKAGIAVLRAGAAATSIPDGDYQGVFDHLAWHLRAAGDAPEPLTTRPDPGGPNAEARSRDAGGDAKARVTLDGSYEQLQERLRAAIQDWAPAAFPSADIFVAGLEATYPDHLVAYVETWSQPWGGGEYHSVPYEVDADGVATLNEPSPIELVGVALPKCLPPHTAVEKKTAAPARNGRFTSPASVLAEADLLELGG